MVRVWNFGSNVGNIVGEFEGSFSRMPLEKDATSDSVGLQKMKQRSSRIVTEEGMKSYLSFVPRADDIIIVTPAKCGSTWMHQIVHQLRSGGDMSFDDISEEVPYTEVAYDLEQDLEAEQSYKPRCYKTHACFHYCPKGAKYIMIYREPCAAFYSFFNFLKGWYFEAGGITLDEFVNNFVLACEKQTSIRQVPSYFEHLLSCWEHRHDKNVLFLFYEDMKENLDGAVRKVAEFMGIKGEAKIQKAVEMSSFEFMKRHQDKFEPKRFVRYRNAACGIPNDRVPTMIAVGSATKGRDMMSEEAKEKIQAKWTETVTAQIGFKDYDELRSGFKKERSTFSS